MTITRYRKGQLSVPLLYTPIIDTLSGDLVLRSIGTNAQSIANNSSYFHAHIRLANNMELRDALGNPIIAGDNTGHIDQLARIDCAVTNPVASHEVIATPAELCPANQSGAIEETNGRWTTGINDLCYMYLGTLLQHLMLLGTVVLESITVYMNSTHVDDYINVTIWRSTSAITGGAVDSETDGTDIGNGSTGDEQGTITLNKTLATNCYYFIEYNCLVPNNDIIIRAIKVKYHLV